MPCGYLILGALFITVVFGICISAVLFFQDLDDEW
jgi:hypothetical protein